MSENKKKLRENKKKIKDNPPVQGKKPLQPVMVYDEEEPKKRTGSIAIPFLVTIFIGLLIVHSCLQFLSVTVCQYRCALVLALLIHKVFGCDID